MLINKKSLHGGDIYENSVDLDFSVNINPFGMPDAVKNALTDAVSGCCAYPDPYCTALRHALSAHENVPYENIICANGAAELIYQFAYALPKGKPALVISPAFCEYESALKAADIGAEYYYLARDDGFALTDRILNVNFSDYSAVFLCSPNNPTGITVDKALLYATADSCLSAKTKLFCDFCFLDLSGQPDKYDTSRIIECCPNVFILKAFTKSYGMAGVRLGYGMCGDGGFLGRMSAKTQCWNVSSLAQAAGVAALGCDEWLLGCVDYINAERCRISSLLDELGITVYGGEANYLLLHSEIPLYEKLLSRRILVRDCSNYVGLGDGFVRIAVRSRAENDLLIDNIREIIKK
ncbi:MAG: histidinol-phosphate transaminase [Eubacteriales bacterium]